MADAIEKLLARVKTAVENKDTNDGLGTIDWSELSNKERIKFLENFSGISEDLYTITLEEREFVIKVLNLEK